MDYFRNGESPHVSLSDNPHLKTYVPLRCYASIRIVYPFLFIYPDNVLPTLGSDAINYQISWFLEKDPTARPSIDQASLLMGANKVLYRINTNEG